MSDSQTANVALGCAVLDQDGSVIGTVDGVFVDYLLVRTRSLLPVDLYIPSNAITDRAEGRVSVNARAEEARMRWGRPLRRAPHEDG